MPAIVAVMVVVPGPTDVANPLAFSVATVVVDEVHVTELVMLLILPSEKLPVATNCTALPLGMGGFCGVIVQFIETRQITDTSCAKTPAAIFPAVGRFPLVTSQARPADVDPSGGNQISEAERKVVTVSVAAATDAMQRSYLGSGHGVGLRAGTFHTDFSTDPWKSTLTNCAFATDVLVSGTVTWAFFSDSSFVADLVVSGPATAGGTLHVEGFYQGAGPVGNFKVPGTLGGKQVATLVPEA